VADWVGVDVEEITFGDERVPARVWRKFDPPDDPDGGCWLWTGRPTREGYGRVTVNGDTASIHRYMYRTLVGEIPDGHVLDHVCHSTDRSCNLGHECPHRRCGRPDHMEPVTNVENAKRIHAWGSYKTHCPQGHPYDEGNTRWYRGMRYCITCRREAEDGIGQRYRERHREQLNARQRARRAGDPEKYRQRFREWHAKNKDYQSERHKQWRARDPERARQRVRDWRERKRREQNRDQPGLW
jgi:hypothetical protein